MDKTIRNISELEEALSKSFDISETDINNVTKQEDIDNTTESSYQHGSTNSYFQNIPEYNNKVTTKERMNTARYSTYEQLHNLSGLTTQNMGKLDILNDSMMRLNQSINVLINNQMKTNELLSIIARNTSQNNNVHVVQTSSPISQPNKNLRDIGFQDTKSVIAELIQKILTESEKCINKSGKAYVSTRTMKETTLTTMIKFITKYKYKVNGIVHPPIQLPDSKQANVVSLATKLGSSNGISPIINSNSLREILNDSAYRTITSSIRLIMERMCVIKILLPYYEADVVSAIYFPYFNETGELTCDWSKINPRTETPEEIIVQKLKQTEKDKLSQLLLMGVKVNNALKSINVEI